MLLGRLLAQQPDSFVREIRVSTPGFGSVCVCVCFCPSLDHPPQDCTEGPAAEDMGATTCPVQAIAPEKAEAEFFSSYFSSRRRLFGVNL